MEKVIVWIIWLFRIVLCNAFKNIKWLVASSTSIRKTVGQSTDFLFGEVLESVLSFTETYSFNESTDFASIGLEKSS